jgi:pantoate--beta-alanine ligase
MKILTSKADFRAARAGFGDLGFAPTMGFLHEGHLRLMRRAKAENGAAAASIFVNPTQFAPGADFDRYPRALERDLAMLEGAGVDLVFTPDAAEMYPDGFDASIHIGGVSQGLEGAARPGHFDGVATVVTKLLNIVAPTRAYFGQKDAQQAAVITKLVRDLDIPVQVIIADTVREADGLAMSSRNSYLDPAHRQAATVLFRALTRARAMLDGGERAVDRLRAAMIAEIAAEPLATLDYVSLADPDTLEELTVVGPAGALVSLAAQVGPARLIDNMLLGRPG